MKSNMIDKKDDLNAFYFSTKLKNNIEQALNIFVNI